jgi:hypothetical protein
VAEKLVYGPSEIPGVGRVEFQWVANPVNVDANATKHEDGDGDVKMGIDMHEDADEREGRNGDGDREANGVDYDVADDEDGWGRIE